MPLSVVYCGVEGCGHVAAVSNSLTFGAPLVEHLVGGVRVGVLGDPDNPRRIEGGTLHSGVGKVLRLPDIDTPHSEVNTADYPKENYLGDLVDAI
jgi:hypothetical protein